jgi:hypothetical protein
MKYFVAFVFMPPFYHTILLGQDSIRRARKIAFAKLLAGRAGGYFRLLHRARIALRAISLRRFGETLVKRAVPAFRAISERSFAESFLARAWPPLEAPSLLKATAAGFFFLMDFERAGM